MAHRLILVLLALLVASQAHAHGGGIDKLGCHHNRKAGGYHCHRGVLAGQTFGTKQEALDRLKQGQPKQNVPAPGAGKSITGKPRIIDGDTIEISGKRIRLHGIDAPEKDQTCSIDGRAWACGIAAWGELVQITAGKEVACEPHDTDRYGRTVAACSADGTDLGDWLVRNGWAVAYYLYSYEYTRAEYHAKTNRRGLWAGEFVMPWEWRRSKQ